MSKPCRITVELHLALVPNDTLLGHLDNMDTFGWS